MAEAVFERRLAFHQRSLKENKEEKGKAIDGKQGEMKRSDNRSKPSGVRSGGEFTASMLVISLVS